MRLCAPILLPIAALFYALLCNAIFADEAYQTDSHHALLGFPQAHTTFFHRPSAASKASLLYTLSEKLVLGAVNPKDGAVIWRQRLADSAQNHTTSGLLKAGEGRDTLISAVNGKVQAWDATDGRLVWEWDGGDETKVVDVTPSAEGGEYILILSEEKGSSFVVRNLAADTGEVFWESGDWRYVEEQRMDSIGMSEANWLQWRYTVCRRIITRSYIHRFIAFGAPQGSQNQSHRADPFQWEANRSINIVEFR